MSYGSAVAAAMLTAGLLGLWQQSSQRHDERAEPTLAVAAFAWAQANCDSDLTLNPGTPRIQAEDLYRAAAMFDGERRSRGAAQACQHAKSVALHVTLGARAKAGPGLLTIFAALR